MSTKNKRTRYAVRVAGEWINCKVGDEQPTGWLHYEFSDGTIGLARPGKWRIRGQPDGAAETLADTAELLLPVKPDEVAVLRFALDHALYEISEAHPEDRAVLKALIERLEAAERKVRR